MLEAIQPRVEILKSLWSRGSDGRWAITDLKSLALKPKPGGEANYFTIDSDVELMTHRPSSNAHEMFASFGTTDFLMKQSVLPVLAWKDGDLFVRCIGTASVISCSGYLLTAAHVLMDPVERGYGAKRQGDQMSIDETLNFGVLIPISPAYGSRGFLFLPFEKFWLWGKWRQSPLFNEPDRFDYLTDIAICKIAEKPHGAAHQPLNMSLTPFATGEAAYSLGYAEMDDIPLKYHNGAWAMADFRMNLYMSIGEVMCLFPENHLQRDVPTPGPCFDFKARITGKMSGAPIFGAQGAVIRGVVSRSFSGDRHAYGAMLGSVMHMPLHDPQNDNRTLRTLIESGDEGMAQIHGMGL